MTKETDALAEAKKCYEAASKAMFNAVATSELKAARQYRKNASYNLRFAQVAALIAIAEALEKKDAD